MGYEPLEELHVSLIYTAAAPHQHPRETSGGGVQMMWENKGKIPVKDSWTGEGGRQTERLTAKQGVTAQKLNTQLN